MINVNSPFVLYANCSIIYKGRASSTIGPGRRLIIHKSDGTLIIHGSSKSIPINYNTPGATLRIDDNIIISESKTEILYITVYEILNNIELIGWSNASINIKGTEKQLCDKILNNCNVLLDTIIINKQTEFSTPVGSIDIVLTDKNCNYCIEVKRKKATMTNVYQLHRYMQYLPTVLDNCVGILAAPEIGIKALGHLDEFGYKFMCVKLNNC